MRAHVKAFFARTHFARAADTTKTNTGAERQFSSGPLVFDKEQVKAITSVQRYPLPVPPFEADRSIFEIRGNRRSA